MKKTNRYVSQYYSKWNNIRMYKRWVLGCLLLILCSGCTLKQTLLSANIAPAISVAQVDTCLVPLQRLDALAEKHQGALEGERIQGVPWLRYNRFLARYFKRELSAVQLDALLQQMGQLAQQSLQHEVALLPKRWLQGWRQRYQLESSDNDFIRQCSQQLMTQQLRKPSALKAWLKTLPNDDDYSKAARVFGLYPVVKLPFAQGVEAEQHELRQQWGVVDQQAWQAYQPQSFPQSHQIRNRVIWQKDALGIPTLSPIQQRDLLNYYAPVWMLDSVSRANLPGLPRWQPQGLVVDTSQPVTFHYLSYSHWRGQVVVQLNYMVWFSKRPKLTRLDWVAGQHDAVIFRVNLVSPSQVLAYDSIHLCGCWYRLFLPPGRIWQPVTDRSQEPILMQRVKAVTKSQRMAVYLSRDEHQIVQVTPITTLNDTGSTAPYRLQPLRDLYALPSGVTKQAVFDKRGYVPGSERLERWLFWPMGVKNPGALRRPGDHAINFVGQRYFDQVDLFSGIR